jgi:hypothetical protein
MGIGIHIFIRRTQIVADFDELDIVIRFFPGWNYRPEIPDFADASG